MTLGASRRTSAGSLANRTPRRQRVSSRVRAGQAVVAKMRGRPRVIVDEFRAAAEADAIFLVELVIEIEDAVASAIQGESLRWLALALEFQVLRAEVVGGGGAHCDWVADVDRPFGSLAEGRL